LTAKEIYQHEQQGKILRRIDRLPTDIVIPLFSEWAEENRYLPPGVSEYPGKFTFDIAPQIREILDSLHPDSGINDVTLMKSRQSTGTVGAGENFIGAAIANKTGSVLCLTSNKGVAKIRSSSAIDVMIDNAGLSELLKPMSSRMKRKSADTSYYKEFSGGIKLLMTSYGSIGDIKSNTFGNIFLDEWDEAPPELKDQGDIEGVILGSTMTVRGYRVLRVSTPSRMETSRIYKAFLMGDQRYYYVPCPICGEMQILELKGQDKDYGLTFTMEKGKRNNSKVLIPETVRYICRHCKKSFMESKKAEMLLAGEWKPTANPVDKTRRSYYISGLMSPEMFLSWERICQQFINTGFGEDLLLFKDFTINYLGKPWASVQKNIEWQELRDRSEDYVYGIPPEFKKPTEGELYAGPLIITGGVDVHKDRLEMHIIGVGIGLEKWSIDYKIFYGDPSNINDVSWSNLDSWVCTHTYKIAGKENYISRVAIDTGYQPEGEKGLSQFSAKAHIVYEFTGRRPSVYIAIKGVAEGKVLELIKEARVHGSVLKKRYDVDVSIIKEIIMSNIDLTGGPGAIHLPRYTQDAKGSKKRIPDDHYRQFLSERYQEKAPKKFGWVKIYTRNEVWDTFIYAMAAAEFLGLSGWTNEEWMEYYFNLNNN